MKSFAFLAFAALFVASSASAAFTDRDLDVLNKKVFYLQAENMKLRAEATELRSGDVCDDCISCVDEIVVAVETCEQNTTSTMDCVKDALSATSECIICVCDVFDFIVGGEGYCSSTKVAAPKPQPLSGDPEKLSKVLRKAFVRLAKENVALKEEVRELRIQRDLTGNACDQCFSCIDDIEVAVVDCENEETTTIECVEDALHATADCIECVCDFIDVFWGSGSGDCAARRA